MTFDEYWTEMLGRGTPDNAVNRSLAMATWDAALCAATACCFERGKARPLHDAHASIGRLHTWSSSPVTHHP